MSEFAELSDFQPSNGHRHDCPTFIGNDLATEPFSEECDCAAQLYRIAEQLGRDGHLLDRIEAKLGPVTGGQILVLRDCIMDGGGEQLLTDLVECAQARGLTGNAAEHVPLVVCLGDGASLEVLDEDEMRAAGWVRA